MSFIVQPINIFLEADIPRPCWPKVLGCYAMFSP